MSASKFGRYAVLALMAIFAAAPLWASGPGYAAEREVTQSSGVVSIARGQGRLVRLASPAASVFIANPAIADVSVKSSRMVYVFGITTGTTTLFAVDKNENIIADIDIAVSHDLDGLNRAIETLLPSHGVQVSSVSGGIVLDGTVATPSDAENLRRVATRFLGENEEVINRLDVTEPNQVNVRVRIAEVSRSAIKEVGLNADIISGDFRLTTGDVFLDNPAALSGTAPFFNLPGNPFSVGSALLTPGSTSILALFDALEEIGLAKTLAEPNLTAISGETASFLAGGEFPIPVAQNESTITISFKQFGVSLAFTPTVLSANRISMRVRPEVSELSDAGAITIGGLNIRALSTRRAETTIELGSGQSFAIAGLLQENFQDTVRQLPYVADIPLLGELFKSEAFRRNETELIIVVTPYVVKPIDNPDLPLPTDPVTKEPITLANERERKPAATLSRIVQVPLAPVGDPDSTGAASYILD